MALIIDALKEACRQVHAKTRGIAGTASGSRQVGRGAGGDMSRRIDLVAEKAVIDIVRKRRIDATIIGEECGRIEGRKGYVIMDAIDGTTNAVRRIPFYCCSLAYATDFRLSAVTDAAVIDLVTGDLYHASKGKGAFCNGRRISAKKTSGDAIIGMNISALPADAIERLAPTISGASHVRQFGANALEMCYLAGGLLDAFVDLRGKIRPTDIAAGYLIAKEAGAILRSMDGEELDSDLDVKTRLSFFAAANRGMLRRLVPLTR